MAERTAAHRVTQVWQNKTLGGIETMKRSTEEVANLLNLGQIRAFLAIVDAGGFREAATALGYAQPTVSQQMRKLEETLGATLIIRNRARCVPTPQGLRLLPYARSLVRTALRATEAIGARALQIGASSNIGIYLLPRHIRACFGDAADQGAAGSPNIVIGSNPATAERLVAGEIDLAVMEWWDNRAGFTALPWRSERLVVVVWPEHKWASRPLRTINVDELLATPLLGGEPGSGTATLLRRVFGERSSGLRIAQSLGSTEAVKEAVKAGLGVSLVLEGAITEEVAFGSLVPIAVDGLALEKTLWIVLPDEAPDTAPARAFARALVAGALVPNGQGDNLRDQHVQSAQK
jgi:DNA-binding transcriptional LysR family regulator